MKPLNGPKAGKAARDFATAAPKRAPIGGTTTKRRGGGFRIGGPTVTR